MAVIEKEKPEETIKKTLLGLNYTPPEADAILQLAHKVNSARGKPVSLDKLNPNHKRIPQNDVNVVARALLHPADLEKLTHSIALTGPELPVEVKQMPVRVSSVTVYYSIQIGSNLYEIEMKRGLAGDKPEALRRLLLDPKENKNLKFTKEGNPIDVNTFAKAYFSELKKDAPDIIIINTERKTRSG